MKRGSTSDPANRVSPTKSLLHTVGVGRLRPEPRPGAGPVRHVVHFRVPAAHVCGCAKHPGGVQGSSAQQEGARCQPRSAWNTGPQSITGQTTVSDSGRATLCGGKC